MISGFFALAVDSEVIRVECLNEGRNPFTKEIDLAKYLACVKRMTEEYVSKYGEESVKEPINEPQKPLTHHNVGVVRPRSVGLGRWLK